MSASMNVAILNGRLTKDVDLRTTPNGMEVGTFTLAVDRPNKDQNGNRQADFINCVVWNSKYSKMAENLATYAHKGSLIGVQGRIQTRNYEGKDGNRIYVTEVRVDRFDLLDTRQAASDYQQGRYNGQQGGFSYQQGNQPQYGQQAPQGQTTTSAGQSGTIDVSSDDLPF